MAKVEEYIDLAIEKEKTMILLDAIFEEAARDLTAPLEIPLRALSQQSTSDN